MVDGLVHIRSWLADHPSQSNPVRQEAFFMSYAALMFRSLGYGVERSYEQYTAHELVEIIRLVSGPTAVFFAKAAFGRALAEEHDELIRVLAESGFVAETAAWTASYLTASAETCLAEIASIIDGEERQMARLLIGRRFPATIAADWLVDDPVPAVMHALLRLIVVHRPDLHHAALAYLTAQPSVLFHGDPDTLLAPLVAQADRPPQVLLPPFDDVYGDGTVIAAAEWHLEHEQPDAALELASRLRPLSTYRDRALRVQALASIELGRPAEAERAAAAFIDTSLVDDIRLRLIEHHVGTIDQNEVLGILDRCGAQHPERFYRGLLLLLRSGNRTGAEQICRAKAELYHEHPALAEIIRTVLRGFAAS